jgi:zinc protease
MHSLVRSLSLAVFFAAAVSSSSQPAVAQPRFNKFLGGVEQRHLDNGLTVVVQEDHHVPLVSLALRYEGGESASPSGLEGTATMTERLMADGATSHVAAGDYARLLARAGATGVRDWTWSGGANLDVTLPANRLALPLWLWSEQMGFFADGLADPAIATQKNKLREQLRTTLDGGPMARVDVFAAEELYPQGHPYRTWYITPESIDHIDRAAILAFHDRWMIPARATLVIVGDVAAGDAFALAERYFGPLPRGDAPAVPPPPAPPLTGEAQVDVVANMPTANVSIRWLTPRELTTDDARLDVVAHLLAGHATGWLAWKLVDEQKIATRVTARQRSAALASQFEVAIEGARGKSVGEVLTAFDTAMDAVRQRAARPREIGGAVYENCVDPWFSLEGLAYRAQRYATYSLLVGTPDYLEHNVDRYRGITPEIVRDAIARWLPADRRVVLLVTPSPTAGPGGERTGRRFAQAVHP